MSSYKVIAWVVCSTGALALAGCDGGAPEDPSEAVSVTAALSARPDDRGQRTEARLDDRERLGKLLFEDQRLSASGTQACASCHEPSKAFTGNNNPRDPLFPVSTGAFPSLLGARNSPTAMYMLFSPRFGFVEDDGELTPTGGQFWDGRADTLADQAKAPFLNPREMALTSKDEVIARIKTGPYADLFRRVYGMRAFADVDLAYDHMAEAIAAFEMTDRFAPFSSKFDAVLRGRARFTRAEALGFALFKSPTKGNCISCHAGEVGSREPRDWLFTDFTYDNLGVPRNPEIPDNSDPAYYDLGLCQQPGIAAKVPAGVADPVAFVAALCGAFKVPTLRNVAVTAPYTHNGYFKRLRDLVKFYVTRDTNPELWYPRGADGRVAKFNDLPSEYQGNVNTQEVPYDRRPGEPPHLDDNEIDDVVAFLKTLTDGYCDGHERP